MLWVRWTIFPFWQITLKETILLQLKCCGTYLNKNSNATYSGNSWIDNSNGTYSATTEFKVPKSCCTQFDKVDDCRKNPLSFNATGCLDKLEDTFHDNKNTFLIAGIVIMVIMVSTVIMLCSLIAYAFGSNCQQVEQPTLFSYYDWHKMTNVKGSLISEDPFAFIEDQNHHCVYDSIQFSP